MLDALMRRALADAHDRRQVRSTAAVEQAALAVPAPLDARAALASADRVKIIAEIKRASPSRGPLADIPDPPALAQLYEEGGASAISVLTEPHSFGGSLDDLTRVKQAVSLPVLRKDFLSTEYQILEARAAGADLILLIVAGLDSTVLSRLRTFAAELGMAALVETHSADEISRAVDAGGEIIGVNARNLHTFELDRDLFARVADRIPDDAVRVAESAVRTPADVAEYRRAGADVVLVGEALVTSDPVASLTEYVAV